MVLINNCYSPTIIVLVRGVATGQIYLRPVNGQVVEVVALYLYSVGERVRGEIAVVMKSVTFVVIVANAVYLYNYPAYYYYLHVQQFHLLCILEVQLEDFDVLQWTNP